MEATNMKNDFFIPDIYIIDFIHEIRRKLGKKTTFIFNDGKKFNEKNIHLLDKYLKTAPLPIGQGDQGLTLTVNNNQQTYHFILINNGILFFNEELYSEKSQLIKLDNILNKKEFTIEDILKSQKLNYDLNLILISSSNMVYSIFLKSIAPTGMRL